MVLEGVWPFVNSAYPPPTTPPTPPPCTPPFSFIFSSFFVSIRKIVRKRIRALPPPKTTPSPSSNYEFFFFALRFPASDVSPLSAAPIRSSYSPVVRLSSLPPSLPPHTRPSPLFFRHQTYLGLFRAGVSPPHPPPPQPHPHAFPPPPHPPWHHPPPRHPVPPLPVLPTTDRDL